MFLRRSGLTCGMSVIESLLKVMYLKLESDEMELSLGRVEGQ